MALAGRNDNCPCGSGKKYKRCCIDGNDPLIRSAEALTAAVMLPNFFPLLTPQDDATELWLAQHAASEPSAEVIDAGIERLPEAERKRMLTYARGLSNIWEGLVADTGDEELVSKVVVSAALVAALSERRGLEPARLDLIEESEETRKDVLATLSFVLGPTDLWNLVEAQRVGDSLDEVPEWLDDDEYERRCQETLELERSQIWSEAHERRLCLLVERVAAQLPAEGYPNASAALAAACGLVAENREARLRLAEMLLYDALDPLEDVQAEIAAAA